MVDPLENLKLASFWEKDNATNIKCVLCPHRCIIKDGKRGFCSVRINIKGKLYSLAYGHPAAIQIDPIEKKPFAEFMPQTFTFSLGTYGCNLNCSFCQNYHLSREIPQLDSLKGKEFVAPEIILQGVLESKCKSVALTYNEPTVWIEYAMDIAKQVKTAGLAVILVSNGYINIDPAKELYPLVDAANIDMKGFSEEFYLEMTGGKLKPVLDAIKYFYDLGKHLEITNLIIPGKNDTEKIINDYLDWVEKELSKNIPLHFSAFHPIYKCTNISRTPAETLLKIESIAKKRGFTSVHLGNIGLL